MLSMRHHRLGHFTSPYTRNFWRCFSAVRSSVSGNQTKKRVTGNSGIRGDRRLRTSKVNVVTFVGGKKQCASTLRTETSTRRHALGDDQKERIETLRDKCDNGKD